MKAKARYGLMDVYITGVKEYIIVLLLIGCVVAGALRAAHVSLTTILDLLRLDNLSTLQWSGIALAAGGMIASLTVLYQIGVRNLSIEVDGMRAQPDHKRIDGIAWGVRAFALLTLSVGVAPFLMS